MPRWAIGRLPELAIALTTLGRVQGNVTVLARQMECEEASVRAWLLRLRELGDMTPDVPPPPPEVRLRTEGDRLRSDLDEALAQRNELDEELRTHKAQTAAEIAKLRKQLEIARQQLDERAVLLTKIAAEALALEANEATARQRAEGLQAEHSDAQEEISRLQHELSSAKNDAHSMSGKLTAAEQERAALHDGEAWVEKELAALRDAAKKPTQALAPRASRVQKTPRRPEIAMEETSPAKSKGTSAAMNEARILMDEQVLKITHVVSLAFLDKARKEGRGDAVQLWLAQHSVTLNLAAQLLTRTTLTSRMGQDAGIPLAKAAQNSYLRTLAHVQSEGQGFPADLGRLFQERKDFLVILSTAIIIALDSRSSTGTVPSVPSPPPQIPSQTSPAKHMRPAVSQPAASRPSEPPQAILPSQVERQMPRINRSDSLASLMRDKVELLHTLAEYQEEQGEEVTGQLLEPYNEATIAAAARQAARAARREYYFRPHGQTLAAAELSWVIQDELLDPRSEKDLFDEVLDQIERLKVAVEKVKPKGNPW